VPRSVKAANHFGTVNNTADAVPFPFVREHNSWAAQAGGSRGRNGTNYFAYNFIKIHRTLRMSPAMAAGVTDRLWEVNDLVALWGPQSGGRKEGRDLR
jgi:hypothetical protein